MLISIPVTFDHITRARAILGPDVGQSTHAPCDYCPLALAAQDAGYPGASVGVTSIWLGTLGGPFELPERAHLFVETFDMGDDPEPETFVIDTSRPGSPVI